MNTLLNFHQFTHAIATSGQPGKNQFRQIADGGFAAVINLAMPDSDNAISEEGSIVSALGMSYFHIPVPFDNPRVRHLKQFFALMAMLEDEKVFVHCAVNARVSVFVYKYLTLKKGMPENEATSPLLQRWQPRMDTPWRKIMALTESDMVI